MTAGRSARTAARITAGSWLPTTAASGRAEGGPGSPRAGSAAPTRGGEGTLVELTYGPAAQPGQDWSQAQAQTPARPELESDFVRSLPDWARRFLREGDGQSGAHEPSMSTARDISSLPREEQTGKTVQWTAPGYRPPEAPITYREKKQADQAAPPQPRLSEAEMQRAADRIYQMIEDRIRRERRRLGL